MVIIRMWVEIWTVFMDIKCHSDEVSDEKEEYFIVNCSKSYPCYKLLKQKTWLNCVHTLGLYGRLKLRAMN